MQTSGYEGSQFSSGDAKILFANKVVVLRVHIVIHVTTRLKEERRNMK